MPASIRPARALLHPLWWAVLFLLLANDHLFKGAGVLPGWLTGKLSDFAGLFVAPAVLAALFAVRSRRGFALAHVAIAFGFAAINVSPAAARVFEAVMLCTPFPWAITVDPSDLVALPMVALSYALLLPWAAHRVDARPLLARGAVALGALACVATSPPEEAPPPEPPAPWFAEVQAVFMIANGTDTPMLVRVRELRDGVVLDCNTIGDPTAMISPDLFDVASAWWLEPGLAVPVEANFRTCRALLVDGPELAPSLFYWRSDSYPAMWLPAGDVDALGMRALRIVPGQTRARFQENGVRFAAPERVSDAPEPACEVPAEGTTAGWTEPPATGGGVIEALSTGPDGCHAIDVPAGRWYFCAPGVPFPFEVGDEIQIGQFSDGGRVGFGLSSGPVTLFVENTVSSFATAAVAGCPGHRDACGGFTRPLALRVPLDGQLVEVRAGESVTLDSGATLYVLRAELPSVIDLECTSVTAVGVRAQTITLIDRRQ